jgi:hypothetical protein
LAFLADPLTRVVGGTQVIREDTKRHRCGRCRAGECAPRGPDTKRHRCCVRRVALRAMTMHCPAGVAHVRQGLRCLVGVPCLAEGVAWLGCAARRVALRGSECVAWADGVPGWVRCAVGCVGLNVLRGWVCRAGCVGLGVLRGWVCGVGVCSAVGSVALLGVLCGGGLCCALPESAVWGGVLLVVRFMGLLSLPAIPPPRSPHPRPGLLPRPSVRLCLLCGGDDLLGCRLETVGEPA